MYWFPIIFLITLSYLYHIFINLIYLKLFFDLVVFRIQIFTNHTVMVVVSVFWLLALKNYNYIICGICVTIASQIIKSNLKRSCKCTGTLADCSLQLILWLYNIQKLNRTDDLTPVSTIIGKIESRWSAGKMRKDSTSFSENCSRLCRVDKFRQ